MLILASQSPRRQELLARVAPDFITEPAAIDERALPQSAPATYVQTLAQAKGQAIAAKHPDATVIAADTMVAYQDQMLGKPRDREDAAAMLTMLAGQTHQVHTGLFVRTPQTEKLQVVTTEVTFWPLTAAEIAAYLDMGEYQDKAGAYGIQGQGALLVNGIVGDYYNVMGLPISTLARLL